MSSSSNTAVIVTGAALLVAGLGLGYMTYSSSQEEIGSRRALVEAIDEEEHDVITEDDVVQIFDRLFLEIQNKLQQVLMTLQQYQMMGQSISKGQMEQYTHQELNTTLHTKQKVVFEEFGVDEDCLEEAVWEFLQEENTRVKSSVERFQKLWQNATGEPVLGWRPGKEVVVEEILDVPKTIEAAEVYFTALTKSFKSIMQKYKDQGRNLNNQKVAQEMTMEFSVAANTAGSTALEGIGCNANQFEASVKAHENNQQVAQTLTMLNMQQQTELAQLKDM